MFLRIIRPLNCFIAFLTVMVFFSILGVLNLEAVLAGTSVFLICAGGNVINDYYDSEIDKKNQPNRPIPSGEISLKNALLLSITLFVTANLISSLLGFFPLIFTVSISALLIFYAKRSKKIGLSGNIICAFATSSIILYVGAITHSFNTSLLFIVPIFFLSLSREIVKDIEDMPGDSIVGKFTFPLKSGENKAAQLAATMIFICLIFSFFFILYAFPKGVLFLALVISSYLAIKSFEDFLKNPSKHAIQVQKTQKVIMIILLSGFVIP